MAWWHAARRETSGEVASFHRETVTALVIWHHPRRSDLLVSGDLAGRVCVRAVQGWRPALQVDLGSAVKAFQCEGEVLVVGTALGVMALRLS